MQAVFAARQCMHAWRTLRLGFGFTLDSWSLATAADSTKHAESANDAKETVEAELRITRGVDCFSLSLPEEPPCSSPAPSTGQDGSSISWHCRADSRGGDSGPGIRPSALDCFSCVGLRERGVGVSRARARRREAWARRTE